MKKRACMGFLLLSLLVTLAATSASAQTSGRLVAHVPFEFQISERTLPAGEYTVSRIASSDSTLLVRDEGGKQGLMVMTAPARGGQNTSGAAKLVFNKYGDQCFLAAVWAPGHDGRAVPRSRSERRIRRDIASHKGAAPEVVTIEVAAR